MDNIEVKNIEIPRNQTKLKIQKTR